jgi:hypothetical protein
MSTEMDWSHDFCLYCDRQTTEGIYCSQACRLADLEKAGNTEPVSPLSFASSSPDAAQWAPWASGATSGLHLPQATVFGTYTSATQTSSPPASPRYSSTINQSYFQSMPAQASNSTWAQSSASPHRLSPSSSRSSLSSVSASPTTKRLSDQALSQLRAYGNSFDQIRDLKRRVTLA